MSKTIFFIRPIYGHINPTLGLAKELVNRGEEVIYYSCSYLQEKIESTGATFRLLPDNGVHLNVGSTNNIDRDYWQQSKSLSFEEQVGNVYSELAYQIEDVQTQSKTLPGEIKREKPDYIVYDYMNAFWGKMLAIESGIPAIASIPTFAMCEEFLDVDPAGCLKYIFNLSPNALKDNAVSPKDLSDLLSYKISSTYGIKGFNMMNFGNSQLLNIVYTSRYFQPYGELFDKTFKFVGSSIAQGEATIDFHFDSLGDTPVIYLSLGTLCNPNLDFCRSCFEAFKDFDQKVLLHVGSVIDLSAVSDLDIPGNFIIKQYQYGPQLEILKRANLFLTHGGLNSTTESICHNVPLIVFPQLFDQYVVANQVEQLGAGIFIDDSGLNAGKLREAAQKILSDESFYQNCKKLKETIDTAGGVQLAADEIFKLKKELGIQ